MSLEPTPAGREFTYRNSSPHRSITNLICPVAGSVINGNKPGFSCVSCWARTRPLARVRIAILAETNATGKSKDRFMGCVCIAMVLSVADARESDQWIPKLDAEVLGGGVALRNSENLGLSQFPKVVSSFVCGRVHSILSWTT